jgi:hypothetical protein
MSDELKKDGDQTDPDVRNVVADQQAEPLTTHHSSLAAHAIRLGPPWQTTATDGAARHARKFGRPRTLDAGERLWLVCEHVPAAAEVHVNGTLLGALLAAGAFAADLTPLLATRNEVVFSVASEAPLGAVALEVRRA